MSIYDLEQSENADELAAMLDRSDSAAVRSRAAEALGEITTPDDDVVVDGLIQAAVDSNDARVAAAAVDALDEIGGAALDRLLSRVVDVDMDGGPGLPDTAYVDALEHEMPELRMAAANAVGRSGVTTALPALLDRLEDDDARVRRRAIRAAGRMGDDRAVEPLAALLDDAAPPLRREIARAFGDIGTPRALDALLPLVRADDNRVRLAAVKALGGFGSQQAIEPLLESFNDDVDEIRKAAAYATVDLLSNAPHAQSHELRTAIVDALSTSHGGVVIEALVELFEESTVPHQRRNAAWLLGRVSSDESVTISTLVAALDDDDELVRRFAATSLAELDPDPVESALLEALDTTFGDGRSMIVFTLGKVGSEAARERLLELLDEVDDVSIQEQTLTALSHLGGV